MKHYCPRCAKEGVRVDSPTHEIWKCDTHGVIYQTHLPLPDKHPLPEPSSEPRGLFSTPLDSEQPETDEVKPAPRPLN